ncbi:hypothetical protein EW146_g2746 [Bondarzewia mesenterica]|uniref:Protein kinase domain-containing protein n=1 Tax=Bondarzewia mesenterica TaxID=1095465 RepID=A0A4V3XFP3_9AGAM|nr:hypothetical protein EW146_g2746 [Bondarzewia mesenterica]
MLSPRPPQEATDIFSLSDQVLADRLQFIEEIGFGNWGSVWLCRPKSARTKEPEEDIQVAVKLVHRSKTATTAARVRSLWNEMKIVRSFKNDPHPSIVPFHSFIITPSYALITMDYLPELIPVEVPEVKAREWFRSLLSGVQFLHKRGVVHNDIKPANILISHDHVPVLVDFGFAEKYDVKSSKAFHSNLTYGTPEYLSPERARGLPHDTRKSDVWSLGITFFEVLVGRTPFEFAEGEQFSTKEDLEKYWGRTLRGKWVGTWKMSKSAERLLRRMIQPNADLRCMATDVMADSYWTEYKDAVVSSHRKSASVSYVASPLSLVVGKDSAKLIDIISPWSTRRLSKDQREKERKTKGGKVAMSAGKENASLAVPKTRKDNDAALAPARAGHTRSRSQPRVQAVEGDNLSFAMPYSSIFDARGANVVVVIFFAVAIAQTKKRVGVASINILAPIRGSPPVTPNVRKDKAAPASALGKENATSAAAIGARKHSIPRKPVPPVNSRDFAPKAPPKSRDVVRKAGRVLADRTAHVMNTNDASKSGNADAKKAVKDEQGNSPAIEEGKSQAEEGKSMGSVHDRMREWERERERLRDIVRMKEDRGDRKKVTEESGTERGTPERAERVDERRAHSEDILRDDIVRNAVHVSRTPSGSVSSTPMSPDMNFSFQDSFPRSVSANESGLSLFKQSLKISIGRGPISMILISDSQPVLPAGKTVQMYKSSTLGCFNRRSTQTPSTTAEDVSREQSWDDDELIQQADSTLPVVRQAVRNERAGVDSRADRMTIWIQNVEKVVEDARQNFASSNVTQLPPLPIAPPVPRSASRNKTGRAARLPRKVLAASQIFQQDVDQSLVNDYRMSTTSTSTSPVANVTLCFPDHTLQALPSEELSQVLGVGQSPPRVRRATVTGRSPEKNAIIEAESPSKRKEKSKSQNDLLSRPITAIAKLQFELERLAQPSAPLPLSAVIDRSIFIADPLSVRRGVPDVPQTPSIQVYTSGPSGTDSLAAFPFNVEPYPIRASSASDADTNQTTLDPCQMSHKSDHKNLCRGCSTQHHVIRCPPPVSSDDIEKRRTVSVDELGIMQSCSVDVGGETQIQVLKDERSNTVRNVRRAIKAIVTGKTASKGSRVD